MHLAKLLFSLAPSCRQWQVSPTLYGELASQNFTLRWILCPFSLGYNLLDMIDSELFKRDYYSWQSCFLFIVLFFCLLYFVLWLCTIILINNINIQLQFINLTLCTLLCQDTRMKTCAFLVFVGFFLFYTSPSKKVDLLFYWEYQL